jgi:hypothetical protein
MGGLIAALVSRTLERSNNHNTHRTLRQLVAVNAWFSRSRDDAKQFTLHAQVSFDEERIGGGSGAAVTFNVSLKKCEIVFLPPSDNYFSVIPSSVRSQKPLNPHAVQTTSTKGKKLSLRAKIGLSPKLMDGAASLDAGFSGEETTTASSTQTVSAFHELSKRSSDNHHAWSVNGKSQPKGRLWGPIWDAHEEPLLALMDRRPPNVLQRDEEMSLPPISRIEVRCLRADLDIYDIQFKDPTRHKLFGSASDQAARMKAAEAFLKQMILAEGLSVGDLSDRYSELIICDATFAIYEQSSLDCREYSSIGQNEPEGFSKNCGRPRRGDV